MAQKYSIDTTDGVTTVRFFNKPEFDDICNAIDDVAENYLSPLRLWDLSFGLNLTDTQLRQVAAYGKARFSIPSRIAIVAPKDLTFGMSRMYAVYREDDLVEEKIFRAEEEARSWLSR